MSRSEARQVRSRNIDQVLEGLESEDEGSDLFSQQSGLSSPVHSPPESTASSPEPVARSFTREAAADDVRQNYIEQTHFPPGLVLGNSR